MELLYLKAIGNKFRVGSLGTPSIFTLVFKKVSKGEQQSSWLLREREIKSVLAEKKSLFYKKLNSRRKE